MYPASRLGEGENPKLNLASLTKVMQDKTDWVRDYRAEMSTSKVTLLELHLPGASPLRATPQSGQGVWSESILNITESIGNHNNQDRISIHNVENGDSKDIDKPIKRTTGLPKARKSYGNRGIVVPFNMYNPTRVQCKTERIPVIKFRTLSTAADSFSTDSSTALDKLRRIENLCSENKNFIVTDKLYRLLYDRNLYYEAYNKIKSKPGNMTPGIVPTTLDGMSEEVIDDIISKIKGGTFKFRASAPGRRISIPKPNGKTRPLTIAPPRDKIVQEVIRMILEAIYETSFSNNSHGFRPNRSCHSALKMFNQQFRVAKWLIEGDITKCFDTIDHKILIKILEVRIKDRKFINLIRKALKAGYMEFNRYSHSLVGTPQGSIVSPILANIYLDKLDKFVEGIKESFDRGNKAKINPEWKSLENAMYKAKTIREKTQIRKRMLLVKSKSAIDPQFKKLVYVRYADDWVIGVRGSRIDCQNILSKVRDFLKNELNLELSSEKTKITNTNNEVARFLSIDIKRFQHTTFRRVKGRLTRITDSLRLTAPINKIVEKLKNNGFIKDGVPCPRFLWLANSKDEIIILYNSVYRGITNYYRFVHNFNELSSQIHYILKTSCAKLLAAKFTLKSQVKTYEKFGKDLKGNDKHGFIAAIYGNNPSAYNAKTNDVQLRVNAGGISKASLEGLTCSVCESEYRVEMHHIRKMKDLNPKGRFIDRLMAKKHRKQIPLCRKCHIEYHKGLSQKDKDL